MIQIGIALIGFSSLIYFAYSSWRSAQTLKVKSVARETVEKIIGQLIALLTLLNGLDFFDGIEVIDHLVRIVGYVNTNLSEGWTAASQVISLVVGLYFTVVKNANDAVVSTYLTISKNKKIVRSKSTLAEYSRSLAL